MPDDDMGEMPGPFSQDEPEIDGKKYVLFQLGNEYFGVSSERVTEVVRMLSLTDIPNVPDWFLGISSLRGDILSVIDLWLLWGNPRADENPKEKLIVLQSKSAETNLAIKVDRLREIVTIADDSLIQPDNAIPHIFAEADYKGINVKLIDPISLLSNLVLR